MIGLCVEITTECPGCRQGLPLNALVTHFICANCNRSCDTSLEHWQMLLKDALLEAPHFGAKQGRSTTFLGGQITKLTFGRLEPRCEKCKTDIVLAEALAQAQQADGRVTCKTCGRQMSLRTPPPEMLAKVAPGVVHLFGEDLDQLPGGGPGKAPTGARPIVFSCPKCNAALPVDGSSRTVPCDYCRADVYLPDDLWFRVHPVAAAQRWFLLYDEAVVKAALLQRPFKWADLDDVTVDKDGVLYACGSTGEKNGLVIWAMGGDLKPRWVMCDPRHSDASPRLRWSSDGTLALWAVKKHVLVRLACADGSRIRKLGGREPAGAPAHHLDLNSCEELTIDRDGTILAVVFNRLLRWTADGQPTTTWPPPTGFFSRKEKLRPLYLQGGNGDTEYGTGNSRGAEEAEVDDDKVLADRPLFARGDDLRFVIGWDGLLCLSYAHRDVAGVAKLDRSGKVTMKADLHRFPAYRDHAQSHPGVDAAGNVYVIVETDQRVHEIWRVSPDGRQAVPIVRHWRAGGSPSDEERRLVVAPNGTMWLFGSGGRARAFNPDGTVLFVSEKSRQEDEGSAKKG